LRNTPGGVGDRPSWDGGVVGKVGGPVVNPNWNKDTTTVAPAQEFEYRQVCEVVNGEQRCRIVKVPKATVATAATTCPCVTAGACSCQYAGACTPATYPNILASPVGWSRYDPSQGWVQFGAAAPVTYTYGGVVAGDCSTGNCGPAASYVYPTGGRRGFFGRLFGR